MFCCQYCYKVRRPNFSHRIEMNSNVLTVMQSYVISEMNKSKNNYSLLGYNAVQSGIIRKFRSNLSHPCSGLKSSLLQADVLLYSLFDPEYWDAMHLRNFVYLHRTIRRFVPEGCSPHNHSCKNLKSYNIITRKGLFFAWLIRRVLDWMIGLSDVLCNHNLGLQAITALSLFYTLSISPLHTH
jgi:hypothetical protein